MNTMTATLLGSPHNGSLRVYKLSHPIKEGPSQTVKNILSGKKDRLPSKYQNVVPDGEIESWDILCISDAHTHAERLVFLGFHDAGSGDMGILDPCNIHGKHTMMIHGGDRKAVYPDKVYLRRMASLNGYKFGGIVQ